MRRRDRSSSQYFIVCEGRVHQVKLTEHGEVTFVDHPRIYVELKRKLAWNTLCPKAEEHEGLCACEGLAAYVLGLPTLRAAPEHESTDSRRFRAALRGIRAGRAYRKREAVV